MTELDNIQLGQYKLIEAIGHGGMATVFKAYQESLDRYVAIKVLLSNRDPQFAARFKREARAIAALQHHNILPIYDFGQHDGLLYFVMQYVDSGVSLRNMLSQPIAPNRVAPADRPCAQRAYIRAFPRRDPPRYQARQYPDALAELGAASRFRHR
jgi:serine/threonine protein kinase